MSICALPLPCNELIRPLYSPAIAPETRTLPKDDWACKRGAPRKNGQVQIDYWLYKSAQGWRAFSIFATY
jgi:hypothetical protein